MSSAESTAPETGPAALPPVRKPLPDERKAVTHKFSIAGHEGYLTVGMYEDGSPGEIFLVMAKEGTTISGLMDAVADSFSILLQYGVPLAELVRKFVDVRYEPSGFTKNPGIPYAKSIMDYVVRWLGYRFLSTEELRALGLLQARIAPKPAPQTASAPRAGETIACHYCGSVMARCGSCYRCSNCGSTKGFE